MVDAALAGLFGLLIGSFLNVCIYRFPRDLSVVRPRSFCPECEKTLDWLDDLAAGKAGVDGPQIIAWYDNIPLLSYALLKGRCRHCGLPIPVALSDGRRVDRHPVFSPSRRRSAHGSGLQILLAVRSDGRP